MVNKDPTCSVQFSRSIASDCLRLHELQHAHRLMPGDGIIDQKRFFQIMVEKGFQGPVSVELFNPIYYAMPVEQVIAMGKEKIQAVLKEAYKQA